MPENGTASWMVGAREALDMLERYGRRPHGPEAAPETTQQVAVACIRLAGGDNDKARSLWKEIVRELGYMPHASAVALIRAAQATELMPDIEAPVVGG